MKEQIIDKKIVRNILLNPGPATTSASVKAALVAPDICPREEEFAHVLEEVLLLAKKVVAPPEVLATYQTVLTGSSGTGAVEAVISSVIAPEQKLLILDNGAYGERIAKIATAYQVDHYVLKSTWGDPLDYTAIEKHLEGHAQEYSHLAVIHHETTSGVLNDLVKISEYGNKYNLSTIVDAMSSYAGVEINLAQTPIDYLISSSNKCIHGMAGMGIIVANLAKLNESKSLPKKNFYFNLWANYDSQVNKGQFLFTPPVQIMYSLLQAFKEFFEQGGIKARASHYGELYAQMHSGMRELGFTDLVAKEHHSKVLTAFIEPESSNYSFDQMHDFLYQRGITIYPGKGAKESSFRISNIGDLNSTDIAFFLQSMSEYLKSAEI